MSLAATPEERQRLWNYLGGVVFGNDTGAQVDFHITSRDGQIAIDTKPVAAAAPVVANVGGFAITWPMVLIGGAVLFLLARK